VRLPRKLLALALVVLVLAIGAVGWLGLRPHGPTDFAGGARVELADYHGGDPTGAPLSIAGTDMVARGEYLTRAADCVACHTAPGGKPFAGGMAFPLPFGSLYSTNITPDMDTGIGAWSDEDFVKALHEGVGRDGKHLYPAFPYTSYTLMTRSDVLAVKGHDLRAVDLLLQAGAAPCLRTRIDNCETPREMAEKAGLREIAEMLAVREVRLGS
jgi:hypothetical protein